MYSSGYRPDRVGPGLRPGQAERSSAGKDASMDVLERLNNNNHVWAEGPGSLGRARLRTGSE